MLSKNNMKEESSAQPEKKTKLESSFENDRDRQMARKVLPIPNNAS